MRGGGGLALRRGCGERRCEGAPLIRIHYVPPLRRVTLMAALQRAAAAAVALGVALRLSQPPPATCLSASARVIPVDQTSLVLMLITPPVNSD